MKKDNNKTMRIATIIFRLRAPWVHSLKEKRMIIKSLVAKLLNRYNVSASEILNLQKEKETVLNEFFNIFGISGSVEKRERMISGEMNAMMEQVAVNREMWMGPQKDAIEKINKMFNLKISIEVPKYMKEEPQEEKEKKEEKTDELQ